MIIKPKGMYDIYGNDAVLYNYVNDVVNNLMSLYNVDFIRTPIIESSELFHRSVGETSDIVSKETYDFLDRGQRSMTMRPEGTASVVRSLIENKLYGNRNDVIKYYYFGSMYRYERPQSGRNREFTQFGLEAFNGDIKTVAEIISVGFNIYRELGLDDVVVNINSLGDKSSKDAYTKALKEYLKPNLDKLCPDCQRRYETNPLRIIDCKADKDNEVLKDIPKLSDYLSDESKKDLNELKNLLNVLEVDYVINESIVRGLDYYTGVVYEFMLDGVTLGAGGSYDNLVNTLGGPNLNATGFALGIDRILIELKNRCSEIVKEQIDVFILSVSEEEKYQSIKLSQLLRLNNIKVENSLNNISLKSQFKLADNYNSKFLIILNDEDLKLGMVSIKDSLTKESEKVDIQDVVEYLLNNL